MDLPDEPSPMEILIGKALDLDDDELIKARRMAEEASIEGELDMSLWIAVIDLTLESRENWYRNIGWRPGDPPIYSPE